MDEAAFDINEAVVIKDDALFLVAQRNAALPVEGHHPFGLYYNDCRFLSGWELEVAGQHPRPLVCSAKRGDCASHELTNHELTVERGRVLPPQTLQIRVERDLLGGRTLEERITVRSFDTEPVTAKVVLRMRSGFEPMMWLRGLSVDYKPKRPTVTSNGSGVTVAVVGRDGVERRLMTAAQPAPESVDGHTLSWTLDLRRGRPQTIALRHVVSDGERVREPSPPPLRRRSRARTD